MIIFTLYFSQGFFYKFSYSFEYDYKSNFSNKSKFKICFSELLDFTEVKFDSLGVYFSGLKIR